MNRIIITAIFACFLAAAGSVSAQTSFNEEFTTAPRTECGSPGIGGTGPCTTFTLNLGGEDFDFIFTADGDGGDMIWDDEYGEDGLASMECLSFFDDLNTIEKITIKRADGETFQFDSIFINNESGTGVSIGGYNNGTLVGTAQSIPNNSPGATISFGGTLVDEVRITAQEFLFFNFDSFKGDIPGPNSAPIITAPAQIIINSDAAVSITGISYADPDAGAADVTATFSVPKGILTAVSGSGVVISGSGSAALSATGAVADLNAFIAGSNLKYTKAVGPAENIVMNIGINDNGNTGPGGPLSDTDSVTLAITVPVSLSAFTVD